MWWAQWLAELLRYVGLCKRALIRAKATMGSYINPTGKFVESRGVRFCCVMNYGNLYSDDTGFRSVRLLF